MVVDEALGPVEIPDVVIRRLPIYARTLTELLDAGIGSISSNELAERTGATAAQIRRDLSYFGKFGKQGKGYDIAYLSAEIRRILNLTLHWDVALVGFGHLGQAIARYRGFRESNFHIAAIFDDDPDKIGRPAGPEGLEVLPDASIAATVRERGIKIGIVAVPAAAAQKTADSLVAGQVGAILNYAPVVLQVPEYVCVRDIDPIAMLQSMTYYLDKDRLYHRIHPNGAGEDQ
ncbi:MAG: redox-sensing transcriptional repressor Rex [Chloroflexota bacterium]|nr:redox-sensing transcriptional repressor Rex [Chloroflexota bacterium]